MSDNKLWFGYLEAGDKSSGVVRDGSMSTGDDATMYLFNLKRGTIVEYKKAVVDSKLRELKSKEQDLVAELQKGFKKAKAGFVPRGSKVAHVPEKGRPAEKKAAKEQEFGVTEDFDDKDFADETPDVGEEDQD